MVPYEVLESTCLDTRLFPCVLGGPVIMVEREEGANLSDDQGELL